MQIRTPENTLIQFFNEMNAWEIWAKQNDPKEPTEKEWETFKKMCEEKLRKIFDKFCSPKKRVSGRQCDHRDPPEYQPELESIIEVKKTYSSRVEIITQEKSGFETRNKYILLKKKGKWLINSKQWFDDLENKWQNGVL
jgi:hypothetical protein